MANDEDGTIIKLFEAEERKRSSTEDIFGREVYSHGYTAIPVIMVRTQARLGINPTQFNILVILLSYWFDPARPPFPSKERIAKQIGCSASTVRRNTQALETAGLLKRRQNRTKAGDWGSNSYDLKGLVAKLKSFEPEFAEARELRKKAEAAERKASTPKGRRKAAST